jgi:hypothetical protein
VKEKSASFGLGTVFARNRIALDVTGIRALRDPVSSTVDLRETAWTISAGSPSDPDRMSELAPPPADAPLILVADDVPANVELLFDQLHVLGFRAVAAYDGPSALRVCADASRPLHPRRVDAAGDLGVDDRSTGFEVCRRIKRDPRTARIPSSS